MSQVDPGGERFSSKWVEAAREFPVRPSQLSQATKGFS